MGPSVRLRQRGLIPGRGGRATGQRSAVLIEADMDTGTAAGNSTGGGGHRVAALPAQPRATIRLPGRALPADTAEGGSAGPERRGVTAQWHLEPFRSAIRVGCCSPGHNRPTQGDVPATGGVLNGST